MFHKFQNIISWKEISILQLASLFKDNAVYVLHLKKQAVNMYGGEIYVNKIKCVHWQINEALLSCTTLHFIQVSFVIVALEFTRKMFSLNGEYICQIEE